MTDMDMIAKLSFEVGYLKAGIEHAARDIREGVNPKAVADDLSKLGDEAEAAAAADRERSAQLTTKPLRDYTGPITVIPRG